MTRDGRLREIELVDQVLNAHLPTGEALDDGESRWIREASKKSGGWRCRLVRALPRLPLESRSIHRHVPILAIPPDRWKPLYLNSAGKRLPGRSRGKVRDRSWRGAFLVLEGATSGVLSGRVAWLSKPERVFRRDGERSSPGQSRGAWLGDASPMKMHRMLTARAPVLKARLLQEGGPRTCPPAERPRGESVTTELSRRAFRGDSDRPPSLRSSDEPLQRVAGPRSPPPRGPPRVAKSQMRVRHT